MIRLKNQDEIARIRDSGKILAETYEKLVEIIEEGITTRELDSFARDFVTKRKAKPAFLNYMGYPASLCTSVNSQVIHGIPGRYKLKKGDILSLDFGVNLSGYISDAAITVPVEPISPETRTLVETTRSALYKGIEQAKMKNRIRDISSAVFEEANAAGYGVVREFCGHGVGLKLHEEPQIPNYIGNGPNPRIKKGMVIAIEPMINQGTGDIRILEDGWTVVTADNKLSAHFEHTIAIFETHTEILTAVS
jgi:methionyl aminopeptidase